MRLDDSVVEALELLTLQPPLPLLRNVGSIAGEASTLPFALSAFLLNCARHSSSARGCGSRRTRFVLPFATTDPYFRWRFASTIPVVIYRSPRG